MSGPPAQPRSFPARKLGPAPTKGWASTRPSSKPDLPASPCVDCVMQSKITHDSEWSPGHHYDVECLSQPAEWEELFVQGVGLPGFPCVPPPSHSLVWGQDAIDLPSYAVPNDCLHHKPSEGHEVHKLIPAGG